MEQICISFKNKIYQCTLFSSRECKPFFYWYYFKDAEVVDEVGECVGFVDKEGEIKTTEMFPEQCQRLVEELKAYILQHFYLQRQSLA